MIEFVKNFKYLFIGNLKKQKAIYEYINTTEIKIFFEIQQIFTFYSRKNDIKPEKTKIDLADNQYNIYLNFDKLLFISNSTKEITSEQIFDLFVLIENKFPYLCSYSLKVKNSINKNKLDAQINQLIEDYLVDLSTSLNNANNILGVNKVLHDIKINKNITINKNNEIYNNNYYNLKDKSILISNDRSSSNDFFQSNYYKENENKKNNLKINNWELFQERDKNNNGEVNQMNKSEIINGINKSFNAVNINSSFRNYNDTLNNSYYFRRFMEKKKKNSKGRKCIWVILIIVIILQIVFIPLIINTVYSF